MQRQFKLFLQDMLTAARRLIELAGDSTPQELDQQQDVKEVIMWNFMVLGEATRIVPQAIRDAYPRIAWREAADMRNRVAHGYFSIDSEVLHHTIHNQLPALIRDIEEMLADPSLPDTVEV